MKTVLVTGAHGFVGRHAAMAFAQAGYVVHGIGLGVWDNESPADFGIDSWQEAEITLPTLMALDCRPDVVVHCAGSGSVGFSLGQPYDDYAMTVGTAAVVLEFMRLDLPGARLIYPSSAAVYGGGHEGPIPATASLAPTSPYGVHKLAAEVLCLSAVHHFGTNCSVVRFFSLYGPGLRKQLLWDASRRLVATEPGEVVEFFGTGNEIRDWLHVRDAAALLLRLAETPSQEMIVNGGSGRAATVAWVLAELAEALGSRAEIRFNGAVREGDPPHLQAEIGPALALGWRSQIPLEEGLRDYAAWFRSMTR